MRSKAQTVNGWGIILLAVWLLLLAGAAGCIPSTAGPAPQRDNVATAGKPIVATIEQVKPNEGAVKAGASEARKAAETGIPFISNLFEPLDNLPLITFIIHGARVAEALIDKVSKAQVTTARVEVPTDNGMPASMVVTPESITVTWPDGSKAVTAPKAVPASLDGPFNAAALLGDDK